MLLTGRSEGFIRGRPDLDETIRRLKAFADAGADCLYAPGITTREQIARRVQGGGAEAGQRADRLGSDLTVSDLARSACAASASAVRWRARPGAA